VISSGVPFSLTVQVEDAYGNTITGYTGRVHFQSSDGAAELPDDYTFDVADEGVHTFTGLVLWTRRVQTITVSDTHDPTISGGWLGSVR
jgi:hypothetical protein